MNKNYKAKILKLWWVSRSRKCGKIYKKTKFDPTKYPLQWRNDYLLKKTKGILKAMRIELSVKGYDNLGQNGPALLVGNHQDYIDPLIVLAALAKQTEEKDAQNKICTFVAKEELKYHFFTRNPLEMINVHFLDRNNPRKAYEIYNSFGKYLKENKVYGVVFPEGTRNKEGDIAPFKGASLKIAQKEFLPIVPFTLNNSTQGFNFDRTKKLRVEIIFHKKIPASSIINQSSVALGNRVENIVRSAFKKPELNFVETIKDDGRKQILKEKYFAKLKKEEDKKQKREFKKKEQERKILEHEKKEMEKYLKKEQDLDIKKKNKSKVVNNEPKKE